MDPISLLSIGAFVIGTVSIIASFRLSIKSKEKGSDILLIDQLTDQQFELYLKDFLEAGDYTVEHIEATEELGSFLIATVKEGKVLIKVKISEEKVGEGLLEEVLQSREHFQVDELLVATNSFFKRSAKDFATDNNITLFNRNDLCLLTRKKR